MYSFRQLMTAYMPTIIGRNITGIRPTHDCFCTNLDHIMTADLPTIGQIVWLQKVNLSLLFYQSSISLAGGMTVHIQGLLKDGFYQDRFLIKTVFLKLKNIPIL